MPRKSQSGRAAAAVRQEQSLAGADLDFQGPFALWGICAAENGGRRPGTRQLLQHQQVPRQIERRVDFS